MHRAVPKIVAPLTANGIAKAHREGVVIALSDGAQPGLVFRVNKGSSSWSLLATGANGRKRVTLGSYPDIGLGAARELAAVARKRLNDSTDESYKTLGELVDAYGALEGRRLRKWVEMRRMLRWVFKGLVDTPCGDLTVPVIQRVVDRYEARSAAARAVSYLRSVLKWGRKRGWVTLVAADLDIPRGVDKPRERVLSTDEQKQVLPVLWGSDKTEHVIMRVILLTCCRLSEIADMQGSELALGDNPTLTIPAERYKTGQALTVPLSRQAADILRPLKREGRIFPVVFNWWRKQAELYKATGVAGWQRHDLRRTSATILGELGYAPHVIDAALGHRHLGSQIHSTYNKSRYAPEHKAALQALADYYTTLTS